MNAAAYSMLIAVAMPFIASIAIIALGRSFRLAATIGTATALLSLGAVISLIPSVLDGDAPRVDVLSFGANLGISLRVDELGLVFALLATALWVPSSVYVYGYAEAETLKQRRRFCACFAAAIGAALGLAFAADLLTFLVFLELLTLVTYPLVAHKETPEARASGRRYLIFSLSGGALLTAAVAWTWASTGSLDFVAGGALASAELGTGATIALFALFSVGVGVKAAIMPLHSWLPAAMVAPTPVSALLHAVAVVKAGVFGCLRVVGFVFGPELLGASGAGAGLAAACAITIVVGSTLALRQESLKRCLAYSTISHLSFIVLGAAMLSPWGMVGAILHFANHGMAKITLFLCAGALHAGAGVSNIGELRGVGRRLPWTAAAMTLAALGLAGAPGLCGFVGKLFLYRGAFSSEQIIHACVLLTGSILSAAYLYPIVRNLYRPGEPEAENGADTSRDVRRSMLLPIWSTAALVVVFGVVPWAIDAQYRLALRITAQIFGTVP